MIAGKQMSITPKLKQYIEERSQKIEKYGINPLQVTVTLKTEKYRQIAEAHVNVNGAILQAQDETDEMEASVDMVMSKIEKQLRKYKEKASSHRPSSTETKIRKKGETPSLPKKQEEPLFIALGKDIFKIPKREKVAVSLLKIEEALLQMKSSKKDFFCFRNSANGQLNLLYKKQSGILGLMELID